jgi:hypothetical protein
MEKSIENTTMSCIKCKQEKTIDDFYKNRKSKRGYMYYCKICSKKAATEYHKTEIGRSSANNANKKYRESEKGKKVIKDCEYNYRKIKTERYRNNPDLRLIKNIRNLVGISFKKNGFSKKSKTYRILGCSYDIITTHLQNTFFINYNQKYNNEKVHVDHIIPLAIAKNEEEIFKLNHWTNLQLLKPEDNIKKGDSLTYVISPGDEVSSSNSSTGI